MNEFTNAMKIQKVPWFWWKCCRKKPKFTKHSQLFLIYITESTLHDRDTSSHN